MNSSSDYVGKVPLGKFGDVVNRRKLFHLQNQRNLIELSLFGLWGLVH